MKTILIIYLLLIITGTASAETGIVLNESNYVQYKYDTENKPTLNDGEYIILYENINDVNKNASYVNGIFINPIPIEYEDIEVKLEESKIDPTQTIISGLVGAGTAYLVVKRRKV